MVQLFDYRENKLRNSRRFERHSINCVAFGNRGKILALGFGNGVLKIISGAQLGDTPKGTHRNSSGSIQEIIFSSDSKFLATSDSDKCVALYRAIDVEVEGKKKVEWQYIGKHRFHYKPIIGLAFVDGYDSPSLFSLGEDRWLIECDVARSTYTKGIAMKKRERITKVANPVGFTSFVENGVPLLLVSTDEYKLKLLNIHDQICHKTVLGPAFGAPIQKMIPVSGETPFLVYSTQERVIGLVKLPLDGNPNASMGLIAHPGRISNIVVSHDGQYVFSAGATDYTVNMWDVDIYPLESASSIHSDPFASLIDGGRDGIQWSEIEEYFYYAQIRSQGEESTVPHSLGSRFAVTELPGVMRALGFYPTEKELADLINEVRLESFTAGNGQDDAPLEIDLLTLVRLYVNHRPVFGVGRAEIEGAFEKLAGSKKGSLTKDAMMELLQQHGETMTKAEIDDIFTSLLGGDWNAKLSENISAKVFAEDLLGFEESDAFLSRREDHVFLKVRRKKEHPLISLRHVVPLSSFRCFPSFHL
eukprot:TRINITY_DN4224_c1_g1_i3.p1 TRINITY_DN4224_c1_g1~~TRINITY_DN4224_c1_g1_i3.p1  ORF type:complete len:531 (+),score=134.78 TRINITY_DN4224_c1_g1_i3:2-1594(+)